MIQTPLKLKALLKPIIRPIKRVIKKILRIEGGGQDNYWERRKSMLYYQETLKLAKKYAPDAETVIDVGSHNTQFLTLVDWIPSKTAIDLRRRPSIPGVMGIQGDFMQFGPENRFDLVLCLQVLEHLDSPALFTQKLLEIGKTVVITVPYKWPKGLCPSHCQDPVDEDKLLSWTEKSWLEKEIVTDDKDARLIAVFEGTTAG